jgi:SNF2 family DNA or RNA helicase
MDLELKTWFVQKNRLGSVYVQGEVERQTEKAVFFNGTAIIKPSTNCCKCGKLLTDPVSIELGIGPICAGIDQRDSMSQEDKDEYIRKFSSANLYHGWIPKSVIVNKEIIPLAETKEAPATDTAQVNQEPEVQVILHREHILVKSVFKYAPLCKSVIGGRWNPEKKFWYYPATPVTAQSIVNTFAEVENKYVSPEVIVMAQQMDKAKVFKSLDDLPPIPLTKREPKEHQKRAFWFSKDLPGAALLMDMGCMKTGVAVNLIANNSDAHKVLVICPDKVVRVWPKELEKDCARDFLVAPCEVRGKKISVAKKAEIVRKAYDAAEDVICIVNYESAWRNPVYEGKGRQKRLVGYTDVAKEIMDHEWDMIILDESHRAKQWDGKTGDFVGRLKAKQKLILTGTVMPHSPMDVFSQYKFLDPSVFGENFYSFRNRYAVMGGYMNKQIMGYKNLDDLHEKIYSIAFRVTSDILDLPPVQHIVREFDLDGEAEKYYHQADSEMGIILGDDKVDTNIVIVQMLRMQQITSGYLPIMREYEDDYGKIKKELVRVEKIDSGKADLLHEICEDIDEHEPIVVFCRFQHDLDEVKAVAEKLSREYGEISGRSNSGLDEKAELKDGKKIIGVQLQAGGVGIDFTKAKYGIYYSVNFSLGDYEQSLKRMDRPGQTRSITYFHLVASGTIDQTIYGNLEAKKDVVKSIMDRKRVKADA